MSIVPSLTVPLFDQEAGRSGVAARPRRTTESSCGGCYARVISIPGISSLFPAGPPSGSNRAVKQQNGHLGLLVINKDPAGDRTGDFTLTGFAPKPRAVVWQYGEAEDNAQSQTTDGHSSLASFGARLGTTGSSNFAYAFPAYSMTVLDLSPAVIDYAVSALVQVGGGGLDANPQPGAKVMPNTPVDVPQGPAGWGENVFLTSERPELVFTGTQPSEIERARIGPPADPGDPAGGIAGIDWSAFSWTLERGCE
jgi:hypothetical protein